MEEVIIRENDANQRLDKFLLKAYPNLKTSAMYKAIRNKKIKVNRKRAQYDQKLQAGDHLLLFLPPDLLEKKEKKLQPVRKLDVVYEDDDIVIMNKPAGLLSMKDQAGDQDTLNDRLISWLASEHKYDPAAEQSFTPSIAHRLDRNTSGLVLAGKNAEASRSLSATIRDNLAHKYYLAITDKRPVQGEIELYMKKEGTKALVSRTPKEGYEIARMNVKTIDKKDALYLSEIELFTGRFHQIRACLAFLKTPLVGDVKYQGTPRAHKKGYSLQAYKIDMTQTPFGRAGIVELPKSFQLHL